MKSIRIAIVALFYTGILTSCVDIWNREPDCKVSTKVSRSSLTFSGNGGEEFVEVNPKPYYLIEEVQIGKVGEDGYMYEERATEGYSTANYSVRKLEDGRLAVRTNTYYGETPFKFKVIVKGGDCSKTINCTINP